MEFLEKIKYALIMIGIFALIAFVYMTNKKIKISSLYKLLKKAYESKRKAAQKRIDVLKKEIDENENVTDDIKEELKKLEKEKENLENTEKDLQNKELVDAIGDWFNRNKKWNDTF